MKVEGLTLPTQLISLIEARIWPRTDADFRAQYSQPRATKDRIRLLAPNEDHLDLMAYEALCLLSTEIASQRENIDPALGFWHTHGDLENIDPTLAITIADFGLGSDSPIVLDYRGSPTEPAVLRLAWELAGIEHSPDRDIYLHRTRWVHCARLPYALSTDPSRDTYIRKRSSMQFPTLPPNKLTLMEPRAKHRLVGSGVRSESCAADGTSHSTRAGRGPSHCPHAGRRITRPWQHTNAAPRSSRIETCVLLK